VAERFVAAAERAGLPPGAFAFLHMTHDQVGRVVADARIAHVAFTGSVEGGHAVRAAIGDRFTTSGLELGGKDPAYVCEDASFDFAVDNLVDVAFYNAGQSCCAIERIYVQRAIFDRFVEAYVARVREYRLGDPTDPSTTLGPVVRRRNAETIEAQVRAAVAAGARALVDASSFPARERGLPYLAPQVLVDVDHSMDVMREETFGPVVGIMPVANDAQAIERMNDSRYGLTACVFTPDLERALRIGSSVETGTWFMNRCDYLDPDLPWVGVKDSGRGCTLSELGFEHVTRPKSFHLRR
jgi:acyl-CoA reductase-like NAD-dependent aldehyde dehydrogenase